MHKNHIAVLFHEQDKHLPAHRYIVYYLADFWREDGHEVSFLYGTSRLVQADVLLVHVNLSVVPAEYLEFAAEFPVALNARVSDIRKSRISSNLVSPNDQWRGPVIVKSDLNYGGIPERMLGRSWIERKFAWTHRIRTHWEVRQGRASPFNSPGEYEIYDSVLDVPRPLFDNPQLVVERFLPEYDNELFHTRVYQFLGTSFSCTRMGAPSPIVKANESVQVEDVDPADELLEWRRMLGMDYGKLDYVIHDGQPVLLDVNKTIGASLYSGATSMAQARIQERRRALARGIYGYLNRVLGEGR